MKHILILLLCSVMFFGCATKRLPTTERAQNVIHHYFEKYAKKYPSTAFGERGVTEVEIIEQREIRKGVVAMDAYLTLGSGELRKITATLHRKHLAWRFLSWENPEGS